MTLKLWHRRQDPEAEYNGEGLQDSLTINGVSEVRSVYEDLFVWFEDKEAKEEAVRLTDWRVGIVDSIQMWRCDDLIRVNSEDGNIWFYSDWCLTP